MKLLVSVRSLSEALAAFEGGVDLIDVKEPQQGPLGKASDHIIDEIAGQFHKRCPVSAAMGELIASPKLPIIKRQLHNSLANL